MFFKLEDQQVSLLLFKELEKQVRDIFFYGSVDYSDLFGYYVDKFQLQKNRCNYENF